MDLKQIDLALRPYENILKQQERRRRRLGILEVNVPTYRRYFTGPVERFDNCKNIFAIFNQGNPFGQDIKERIKVRTGQDSQQGLPYHLLNERQRLGQSLNAASWQLCLHWNPEHLKTTGESGRIEFTNAGELSRLIKTAGMYFGAEMVKITKIDERWVYKDQNIGHKYAIICVVSHNRELMSTAPSHLSAAATAEAYSRLKFITTQLSDFINNLGYEALYRETRGGDNPDLLMVPLAIDAGIGEFARNGRVLSPEFGINMRFKAVTTDLPLEVDKPISFGVHDFCMACENCAEYCPPQAIPYGPVSARPDNIYHNPGYTKWWVDAEKCYGFWLSNKKEWTSCGRCISVCPWINPQNTRHDIVRWAAIKLPGWGKKMLVYCDRKMQKRTRKLKTN